MTIIAFAGLAVGKANAQSCCNTSEENCKPKTCCPTAQNCCGTENDQTVALNKEDIRALTYTNKQNMVTIKKYAVAIQPKNK